MQFARFLREIDSLVQIRGVLGVALSGAGPGMLLIVDRDLDCGALERSLKQVLAEPASLEVLQCGFESTGAGTPINATHLTEA